ncbi:MAG: glycosyltransferase family 4 protein [Candidatus Methylacidiphilales bacterium]
MSRRLLFLSHEFFPFRGGVATYVQELAEASHRLGREIEVWTNGSPLAGSDFQAPYPIRYVGGQASLRWVNRLTFILYLIKHREDLMRHTPIFCSYGTLFCGMLLHAFRILRLPHFGIILHGSEILKLEKGCMLNACCRHFFGSAALVATTSQHILERLQSSCLGQNLKRTCVLACAPPQKLIEASALKSHHDGKINILTLARIHQRKGHCETAKALGLLPADVRQRITWQIAGTGDQNYLAEVIRLCRETVVHYHLIGEVRDMDLPAVYADADIYVMSSRSLPKSIEGFGITYLEAGLFGVPVVGYRTGGVGEALLHETTGLLVDEGDIKALSEAIHRLIIDPGERERMGRAGRQHALHFSWDQTAHLLDRMVAKQ